MLHRTLDSNADTRAKLAEVVSHKWLDRKEHAYVLSDTGVESPSVKNSDNSFCILSRTESGSTNELNLQKIDFSSTSPSNNSNQDIQISEDLYKKTLKRAWQESETDGSETSSPSSNNP